MLKHFITISFIACISILAIGQDIKEKSSFDSDNLRFGGTFGMAFSTQGRLINISPSIGYFFTERLLLGTGLSYINFKYSDVNYNIFGVKIYGRYFINEALFLQNEIHETRRGQKDVSESIIYNTEYSIGGGYFFNANDYGRGLYISAMYDILYNPNSFNLSPFNFSIGINL